jgi:hypothetical protein
MTDQINANANGNGGGGRKDDAEEAWHRLATGPPDATSGAEPPGDAGELPDEIRKRRGVGPDPIRTSARSLHDPDEQRANAFDAGRGSFRIERRELLGPDGPATGLYDNQGRVREAAVLLPRQAAGEELLKVVHATSTRMEREQANGHAAVQQADRIKAERVTIQELRVREAADGVRAAEAELVVAEEAFEAKVQEMSDAARAAMDQAAQGGGDTPVAVTSTFEAEAETTLVKYSVFEQVMISPKAIAFALPAEVATTTLILHTPIADLVVASSDLEPYLLAAAASLALTGLGLIAGYAAAAIKLPARLAGLLIVALAAWLLVDGADKLDLLRMGDEKGVTLLTISSLATITIAGVTSYATTRYKAYAAIRADVPDAASVLEASGIRLPIGHPLVVVLRVCDRARAALAERRDALADEERRLAALNAQIDGLHELHDQTMSRVLATKQAGVEAGAALIALEALATTEVRQERAHREAVKAAFELGHYEARTDESPEEEDQPIAVPGTGASPILAAGSRWSPRSAAAGVLASGVTAAVVVPSLPLGVGAAVVAAVLWAAGRRMRVPGVDEGLDPAGGSGVGGPATEVVAVAAEDHPWWRQLPSRAVSKYSRGSTRPTRRH